MHIAMIVRSFSVNGGLELYTHKLVEGLLAQGLHITVLCTQNTSPLTHPRLHICKFRGSQAGLKAQRLVEEFYALNEAIAALTASGAHFDIVHSQHQPVQGADVVTFHNHTVQHLSKVGLPWENLLNSCKSKLIPAYRLRNYFDHLLYKSAQCRIYTSCATRNDFMSAYSDGTPEVHSGIDTPGVLQTATNSDVETPDMVQAVAYPGADLETRCTSTSSTPLSNNTFLFVGKGYRKKGLDVLLTACAQLKKHSVPFKLLVAGLPSRLVYRVQLRTLGISSNVEFLGFQSDMDAIYSQCSYFVMPSRVEPFGMAAVQAMRYGIVPIVSKVSGVSEILSHGQDSLILADHLSAQELASHMMCLIKDKEFSSRLAKQAIVTASKLTWDRTVTSTLDAYKTVLATTSSKGSSLEVEV